MIPQLMKYLRIAFYIVGIPYFACRYLFPEVLDEGQLQMLRVAFLLVALIYFVLIGINYFQSKKS